MEDKVKKIIVFLSIFVLFVACSEGKKKKGCIKPVKITSLPEMKMAGVSVHITKNNMKLIPQAWGKFMGMSKQLKNVVEPKKMWGISYNYKLTKPVYEFDHMPCYQVSSFDNLPAGFDKYTVPAQKYAVFVHKGSVKTIKNTYTKINKWLKKSKYTMGGICELELYGPDFKMGSPDSKIYIYHSIKEKK